MDEEEFDDPDRPLEDWESSDEYGEDDEGVAELRECPVCGLEIYEDAVRCPLCGEYVGRPDTSIFAGRSWWFILLGLAGVGAVIYALAVFG